jgi:hypothetical protein
MFKMIKSGLRELLESVGYMFFMEPNEDGSVGQMGFLTPPPFLRYSPPPQMGISLDDIRVDIVRTAWQDYQTRKDGYGRQQNNTNQKQG